MLLLHGLLVILPAPGTASSHAAWPSAPLPPLCSTRRFSRFRWSLCSPAARRPARPGFPRSIVAQHLLHALPQRGRVAAIGPLRADSSSSKLVAAFNRTSFHEPRVRPDPNRFMPFCLRRDCLARSSRSGFGRTTRSKREENPLLAARTAREPVLVRVERGFGRTGGLGQVTIERLRADLRGPELARRLEGVKALRQLHSHLAVLEDSGLAVPDYALVVRAASRDGGLEFQARGEAQEGGKDKKQEQDHGVA
ncbi:hypothetical protein B0J12DRAFT_86804 [Macrophomina phaseolina]|uniref:Uncharacterized protein n=1 Tax=Macrophomina phaseolina TaxID=35725 RepID=A0ABQ8GAD9_9PEZI|nr:hypothetical protein B0J12DRAFT_86804 [Macrophomina phaseolina]